MTEDLFVHWDGAYVLGALSPAERDAFEEHLLTCDACRTRVDEIAALPALLGDLTAADFQTEPEPMPDTLLPRLLRAADVKRRRSRAVMTGLGAVAAAAIAALVLVLALPGSSSQKNGTTERQMQAVSAGVHLAASVRVEAKDSGTVLDVTCRYLEQSGAASPPYWLVVYDKNNKPHRIDHWQLESAEPVTFHESTSLSPSQISRVTIELAGGVQVLYLDV